MKKTFALRHPKKKIDRLAEGYKHEVKKYIKREERKTLPANFDFWGFDCRYGATEEEAKTIHVTEIGKCIDKAMKEELESFYLEILAKAVARQKRTPVEDGKKSDS